MTPKKLVLPAVLVGLAVVLLVTAIPAVFTIDDDNYIATIVGLRDGSLHLSSTDGLPPSPELLSFDAAPTTRQVTSTPVASVAPPLYAVFAVPFSLLGLRGLILLQVLSFVISAWLVHRITRRCTGRTDLAWFALATFVLASFTIEYAQGIWPHMLAVTLVLTAFDLTGRLAEADRSRSSRLVFALLAGLCAGTAAGVRYQNVALAGLLALTLLVWQRNAILPYLLGLALPLFVSGAMNASRVGSWNPISKGPGYTTVPTGPQQGPGFVQAAAASTWARVVDFTAWPQPAPDGAGAEAVMRKHPVTGAFQQRGALKKALLQSAPWALVALVAIGLAWRRRAAENPGGRELRRMSLLIVGVLGLFALYGFRHDGLCFNQRYLLELMPLLSIALAVAVADTPLRWTLVGAGAAGGVLLGVVLTRLQPDDVTRQLAVMKVPLAIAAAATGAWVLALRPGRGRAPAVAILLGVSLGWAASIHLLEDVPESRALRDVNQAHLAEFKAAVPADARLGIIAYYGQKDSVVPLILDRDVVVVDPWIDRDATVRPVVDALVAQGRTILVAGPLPRSTVAALASGYRPVRVERAPWLFQLVPTEPRPPGTSIQ